MENKTLQMINRNTLILNSVLAVFLVAFVFSLASLAILILGKVLNSLPIILFGWTGLFYLFSTVVMPIWSGMIKELNNK